MGITPQKIKRRASYFDSGSITLSCLSSGIITFETIIVYPFFIPLCALCFVLCASVVSAHNMSSSRQDRVPVTVRSIQKQIKSEPNVDRWPNILSLLYKKFKVEKCRSHYTYTSPSGNDVFHNLESAMKYYEKNFMTRVRSVKGNVDYSKKINTSVKQDEGGGGERGGAKNKRKRPNSK